MLEDIKMGSGTTEQDERKLQTARASYREGLAFGFCAKPHSYHPGGQRPMLVWVWRCQHPEHVDSVDVTAETHMKAKIREVITTDTCPIDSRALSVGWVAWFGFPCYGPALRVGRTKKKSRGRIRAIATTGVLCSPALGESDTYPVVSGGGGGTENRNAPNDTAALSFVENSEAARYFFVVVVIGDVMVGSRRYCTFVLACHQWPPRHLTRACRWQYSEGADLTAFSVSRAAAPTAFNTWHLGEDASDRYGGDRRARETGKGCLLEGVREGIRRGTGGLGNILYNIVHECCVQDNKIRLVNELKKYRLQGKCGS